jgi:tricorn protease
MTNVQSARPYFRTPTFSPDGSTIAFVHAGDIWLVPRSGGNAERLTAHPAGHSSPRFSPDGNYIGFSSTRTGHGDIYVLPLHGGEVRRLTYHDSTDTLESWTPDSQFLFYSSEANQQGGSIYRIPLGGGTPIPWLSQPYERLNSLSISPDGTKLAFNVSRDRWWRRGPNPYGGSEIWVVDNVPKATSFTRIDKYAGMNRWPLWSIDGKGLYFVSDRDGMENIWYQPFDEEEAIKITAFNEGRVLWPNISKDGKSIAFERDFSIWQLDLASGESEPIPIQVRHDSKIVPTQFYTYTREFSELRLSPDGKKVAFVAHGEVFADFADKENDKDRYQALSYRVTNTPYRESDISWSPDSRRLLYISDRHGDEEVYMYDFLKYTEVRLTNSSGAKSSPTYSPDGKWIAYGRGDNEIRLINAETREDMPFIQANFSFSASYAWSPDSRWIVFIARDEHAFSNAFVQRIGETTPHQISFLSNLEASNPIWAPNGSFIIFTTGQYRSEAQIARIDLIPLIPIFQETKFEKLFELTPDERRTREQLSPELLSHENLKQLQHNSLQKPKGISRVEEQPPSEVPFPFDPNPHDPKTEQTHEPDPFFTDRIEIMFEHIKRRLRFLTPTQMDADAMCISPDSRDLIFGAAVAGRYNLWTLPLDEVQHSTPTPRQLTSGFNRKWAAQFTADGKNIYFLDNGQITIYNFANSGQSLLPVRAKVLVDFHQEKLQVFSEAWRLLRDHFYDPTFRGLDWQVAYEQFLPLVAGAQTYSELLNLLNMMVGELRASHLGATPTWVGTYNDGYTGILFDPVEQAKSGRLVVAEVLPDSPAALATHNGGISIGDEVVAINDIPITPSTNIHMLLRESVGRRLILEVVTPGLAPREIAVRPVSADLYDELRYNDWVYRNEEYVHKVSNGRLGYIHIRHMDYPCYQKFLSDLDAETYRKEGVVLDVRFNGGGHTGTFILDVLARRSVLVGNFRDRPTTAADHLAGNRVLNKPTVLVINQSSYSNTEMFAEGYRRLNLGKVVGQPTGGAVVWTFRTRLLDGTWFSLPRIRVATPEGEELEGKGREVDVNVALPVGENTRTGKDRQLDAAVATLLAQIDGTST